MKHVWNYEQLMKNKNEIQKSLIHHIVDDRLQEGTLVTDLIDSIKSSSSVPKQLVSKPVINIVLINYCVNCFITVTNSLEATSNSSTGTRNVTEGCWKETS